MRCAKTIGLIVGAVILVVAVGLVVYGSSLAGGGRFVGRVDELIPSPPRGWALTARPLAESPEMQQAVENSLNFDDVAFMDFTHPSGTRLSVYIAYWRPRKMATKEVAAHTPDVCWVNSGWKREFGAQVTYWKGVTNPIPAGEARMFTIGDRSEWVIYWHIVGGEVVNYGRMGMPPWHAVFSDILRSGLSQRKEQLFIRLSSAQQLDGEALRPVMDKIILQVKSLAYADGDSS